MSDAAQGTQPVAKEVRAATVRFAGDSGDGMQLVGKQFSTTSGIAGNDLSTFPDYPAEIRAPAGSLAGVSAFQIQFGDHNVYTPGDAPDVLVAMNPAALKVHLPDLVDGGVVLVNENAFSGTNLKKAGFKNNPLEDGSLEGYRLIKAPLTEMTVAALEGLEIKKNSAERCRNFFALGIAYWLFDKSLESTLKFVSEKFGKNQVVKEANELALKAGYFYADTTEIFRSHYRQVKKAEVAPGTYRNVSGNQATAMGFIAASSVAGVPLFYGSYPITPASDVLHELAQHKNFGIKTFQAEDEIAAMVSTIGAAFAGNLALTGTSGPGLCLKSEAIGLAVITELPVVILNVQRGGPSTGLPTKTEQSDLLQVLFGRNGESPLVVLAPSTPSDCFWVAMEAFRIATKFMTPVIMISDGYLGNGVEPWRIPAISDLPKIEVKFHKDASSYQPFDRDEQTLARPYAIPGSAGMEHRLGGLEKSHLTGNVSHDAENHDMMCRLRKEKIDRIALDVPELEVEGPQQGEVLVLAWGGTYGAVKAAVEALRDEGTPVANAHLRYLNPFPKNLGDVLKNYKHVLIPELNLGQLNLLIRGTYLRETHSFTKIAGKPFQVAEIKREVLKLLGEQA